MGHAIDEKTPLVDNTNEKTLLPSEAPWAPPKAVIGLLCFCMICCSVGLINFNKWLMDETRFPHAIPLVLNHMIICTVLSLMLRVLKPSLFPALTDPDTQIALDLRFYLTAGLPIAVAFTSSLVLSNMVYSYLGLAFIQMMKESTLIWMYVALIACGLEKLKMPTFQVVCLCIIGIALTIEGELNFSLLGFSIQLTSMFCEIVRLVIQGLLLQGKKMDPLSFVLVTSPLCGVLVLIALFVSMGFSRPPHGMELPLWSEVWYWTPWLVADGILAFFLNVCVALVIKYTSPMSYLISNLVKDVVAVVVSVIVLHETVKPLQTIGFMLELTCAFAWFVMRSNAEEFEAGLFAGFRAVLGFKDKTDAAMAAALCANSSQEPP